MISIHRLPQIVALLALVLSLSAGADQTDERLDELFVVLQTSDDVNELMSVETSIWEIWHDSGQSDINDMMRDAGELTAAGDLLAAEGIYTRVVQQAPQFSEGWNRRATVRFYMGDYEGSLIDIEQTLKLEPRHFGAIWGLGMILGLEQDYERAIAAFEKLLEIKPNSRDVRPRIEMLKQALAKEMV